MAPKFLKLLIPRKHSAKVPDLDINWHAIEVWASQLPTAGGGGVYASLTGPGETTSPGALTQDGDLTVDGSLFVSGTAFDATVTTMSIVAGFGSTIDITNLTSTLEILTGAGGTATTSSYGNGIISFSAPVINVITGGQSGIFSVGSKPSLKVDTAFGNPDVLVGGTHDHVGFYGTGPKAIQTITGSRGGNLALQSLLTALANIGLIIDTTT